MRVTIRHRYSAIEKLIAYFSKRTDFFPGIRSLVCRARDLSAVRLKLAPQLPDNSVSLRVPSLSGGTYARVAELGRCGTGNLSGEREISSGANCGTSSLTPRSAVEFITGSNAMDIAGLPRGWEKGIVHPLDD